MIVEGWEWRERRKEKGDGGRAYKVNVKPKTRRVAHGEDERLIVLAVHPIEGIDIQPVLDKNLRKPRHTIAHGTSCYPIGRGIPHMSRRIRSVEGLPIPAARHGDGGCKAIRTGCEARRKAHRVDVGELRCAVAVAEPA